MNPKFALHLAAALALASSVVAPASAQQITMKISTPTVNDVVHEYYKQIKAGVEKRAGDRIKIQIYPAGQLGSIPSVIEGLALGTVETASAAAGFFVGLEPRFQVLDAPGLFDDMIHGHRVVTDPDTRKLLSSFGAQKGVEILSICIYSPMMMLTHNGVRTLADIQGKKIRTLGGAPILVDPMRKLGALPVSLPLGEVLSAMQNRTIDGMTAGTSVLTAFKYYDVAKPATYLPSTFLVSPILANRKFMKSLGPELEAILRDEVLKAEALFASWGVDDVKRSEETWRAKGGQIISLSPEDAKRYLDTVTPVVAAILSSNPVFKEDYVALLAAAKKHRK